MHYTVAGGAGSGCGHDFPGLSAANWGQPWLGDMGTNEGHRGESTRLHDRSRLHHISKEDLEGDLTVAESQRRGSRD